MQATREATRLTISTLVESVATGIIEVGTATPVVAPLCVALRNAKGIVDEASRNQEDLKGLCAQCELITVQVIDRFRASNASTIDVSPLRKCVDELQGVAERQQDQGRLVRLARFRKNGDEIQRLRARIERAISIMGLAGVVNNDEKLDRILARLQPPFKLAPVPKNAPITKSWHAVRDGAVKRVAKILGSEGGPAMAALTGRSGAGKTTTAAAMVGERGPIRPRVGETEDEARTRLDRVRALFPDGVVWLRVGKGEGAADRFVPALMRKLAKELHENVVEKHVDAPAAGENGESYVKKIVTQESLRCLVVADDVWHAEVIEKLRKTGMWVLLTTRTASIVDPNERVVVDELTPPEAEDVLRGAAGLSRGERLCDGATNVLRICRHVAMDIAFVGRWSSLCTTTDGVRASSGAWADAVRDITTQIESVKGQARIGNAAGMDDIDVNRLAVLRAGFEYIGAENALARKLYVMLAVVPHGHAFGMLEAGVLLNHTEDVVRGTTTILERWAVLRTDTFGRYHMHDAHVDFAREELNGWASVRNLAVQRWTTHISRLDVAAGLDLYTLLDMWRVLDSVGGHDWWDSRPYDEQLIQMDASSQSKNHAVNFVAELFSIGQKFGELEALMQRVLDHGDDNGQDSPAVQMIALHHTRQSLISQGRYQESRDVKRRLGEMIGASFQAKEELDCGSGFPQTSTTFHIYGVCAKTAQRNEDAQAWFRKALKVEEDGGRTASSQAASTLHELGSCVRREGRLGEAEDLLKRALEIMMEAKLGSNHLHVARTLFNLSKCVLYAGRPGEAEELLQRVLGIREAKLRADDVGVAVTLRGMGICARETGRLAEGEKLLRRALKIKEAKLGADAEKLARTLDELGTCVLQAGRLTEAEELLRRALKIKEVKLGGDVKKLARTLHELGSCVRQAGRLAEAEKLLRRALKIKEANLGTQGRKLALTLRELGSCVGQAGRLAEAEQLLRRAETDEAKLGADNFEVPETPEIDLSVLR